MQFENDPVVFASRQAFFLAFAATLAAVMFVQSFGNFSGMLVLV